MSADTSMAVRKTPQAFLGFVAAQELADLAPDRARRREQLRIGLADVPAGEGKKPRSPPRPTSPGTRTRRAARYRAPCSSARAGRTGLRPRPIAAGPIARCLPPIRVRLVSHVARALDEPAHPLVGARSRTPSRAARRPLHPRASKGRPPSSPIRRSRRSPPAAWLPRCLRRPGGAPPRARGGRAPSARLRSVTSWIALTKYCGRPRSSRTSATASVTHSTRPSLRT